MTQFRDKISHDLSELEKNSRLRTLKTIEEREGAYIWINGVKYLNCSSNDYLGIAGNIKLKKKFFEWCSDRLDFPETDLSSSSSRLLTGNSSIYDKTERQIAHLYGKEDCMIFSSGYHMNTGFFAAMFEKGDLIVADKLVHASIIDGLKLSNADHKRYNHLDYDHLRKILSENRAKYKSIVIVTESVFSMDGDTADIAELVKIARYFDAQLFVDEAHAVGCIGETGLGVCEKTGMTDQIDFIAGTAGKALGGVGAFIVCDSAVKQYLVNKCRSFIFTTALPPLNISWLNFIFSKVAGMKSDRIKLSENAALLRKSFIDSGPITAGDSHIVPLITGDDDRTVAISEKLKDSGIFVPSIRPPTVPEGSSRLRFSLTAKMTESEIRLIFSSLTDILQTPLK